MYNPKDEITSILDKLDDIEYLKLKIITNAKVISINFPYNIGNLQKGLFFNILDNNFPSKTMDYDDITTFYSISEENKEFLKKMKYNSSYLLMRLSGIIICKECFVVRELLVPQKHSNIDWLKYSK